MSILVYYLLFVI